MEDFGYQKDKNENKNSSFNRQIFLGIATIISISLFVYITITAYHFVYQDDSNIELIKGPNYAIRVNNEEGDNNSKIDRSIYEDIFGNKKNQKEENVKIINTPETLLPPKKDLNTNKIEDTKIDDKNTKVNDLANKDLVNNSDVNQLNNNQQNQKQILISNAELNENPKLNEELENKNSQAINNQPIVKKKFIRVQIAAMSSQEQAQQQWKKLLRSYPDLFVNLRSAIQKVDLGKRGIFYRLQIGEFFNQIEAENFCQKYISQTQRTRADCIVVE